MDTKFLAWPELIRIGSPGFGVRPQRGPNKLDRYPCQHSLSHQKFIGRIPHKNVPIMQKPKSVYIRTSDEAEG